MRVQDQTNSGLKVAENWRAALMSEQSIKTQMGFFLMTSELAEVKLELDP